MSFFLRWFWLLIIALIAPITLPAGGAKFISSISIKRSYVLSPVLTYEDCCLRSSPIKLAPSLRFVQPGTPLDILRSWSSASGELWLHVQISNHQLFGKINESSRGWIKLNKSIKS